MHDGAWTDLLSRCGGDDSFEATERAVASARLRCWFVWLCMTVGCFRSGKRPSSPLPPTPDAGEADLHALNHGPTEGSRWSLLQVRVVRQRLR